MMVKNERIDAQIVGMLKKFYEVDPIRNLSRLISKWTAKEFSLGIPSIVGGKVEISENNDSSSWIEKTNILEDIISNYIDDSRYLIIFDELDEDYRVFENQNDQKHYGYLITSLFKAIQDIKSIFRDKRQIINPIIFLRDDIYNIIKDSDKNKWSDFKIELDWDEDKIKKMLAFRIVKAYDDQHPQLSFNQAWSKIFLNEMVPIGTKGFKKTEIFEYITKSTQLRPRDYIKYIHVCAEQTLNIEKDRISARTVKIVDKGFSNYMKDEIIDELHPLLPDIENILLVISQIRKWNFTIYEFKKYYSQYLTKETVVEKNIDFVLQTLFHFSVIGNMHPKRYLSNFRYLNKEARFNFQENIIVHRGLFKALQII